MKEYKDFIPKDDASLTLWSHNYQIRFPELAPTLRDVVTGKDITEQQQYAQEIMDAVQDVERLKAELAAAVSRKNRIRAENTRKIRAMAIKVKRSEYYDATIGAALDIVYKGHSVYGEELVPAIKVVAATDTVKVHFTKRRALGAAVFSCYEGGQWELLGKQLRSPFIDKRPLRIANQPERREYMVRIWDGLQCIGQESQIASVVVNG